MSDQPTDAPKKRAPTPRKRKPAIMKTEAGPAPAATVDAVDVDVDAATVDPTAAAVPAAVAHDTASTADPGSGPEHSSPPQSPPETIARGQDKSERSTPDRHGPDRAKPDRAKPDPSRPDRPSRGQAKSEQSSSGRRSADHRSALPGSTRPSAAVIPTPSSAPTPLIDVPLSVRWRDLDAFNHVNNSKYLSYLEEARLRWMMTIPGMGLEDHVAPVVAASTLNYRRPIEWPGEVVVDLFVERMGTTSVTIGHRIRDARDGAVLYCDGNIVLVWIDRNTGRAAPLPDGVRAACGH